MGEPTPDLAELERALKEYAEAQRQLEKAHQILDAAGERVGTARVRLEHLGKALLAQPAAGEERERG